MNIYIKENFESAYVDMATNKITANCTVFHYQCPYANDDSITCEDCKEYEKIK